MILFDHSIVQMFCFILHTINIFKYLNTIKFMISIIYFLFYYYLFFLFLLINLIFVIFLFKTNN